METARLLYQLRRRQRYHRAQRDYFLFCTDLKFCLSVVCLYVIKLLPAYGTDHYQNSYWSLGFFLFCPQLCRFFMWKLHCIYQACEAGEAIIGHRGIAEFCLCLSVSVVCLSVCNLCLSVCHQNPSLWDRSLPKFIFGFFRPLRGSVKI